ncbi:MAG: hypothetical protein ACFFAZ_14990, partial [Promethearchaeota archaeon]
MQETGCLLRVALVNWTLRAFLVANAPHQSAPVLARQNTKSRASFAFVAARTTPKGGRTACDGYLALNPSDFITSSVTSP